MKNLKDLFEHELKDLYSAEHQILRAMPKLEDKASDDKLKKAIEKHLKETEKHVNRLEEICEEIGIKPTGETCYAMERLVQEAEYFLNDSEKEVRDAGIIAEAQGVKHYEISGHGTAVRLAKELGLEEIANKLQETLDEEYKADVTLNDLTEERLNRNAKT